MKYRTKVMVPVIDPDPEYREAVSRATNEVFVAEVETPPADNQKEASEAEDR